MHGTHDHLNERAELYASIRTLMDEAVPQQWAAIAHEIIDAVLKSPEHEAEWQHYNRFDIFAATKYRTVIMSDTQNRRVRLIHFCERREAVAVVDVIGERQGRIQFRMVYSHNPNEAGTVFHR